MVREGANHYGIPSCSTGTGRCLRWARAAQSGVSRGDRNYRPAAQLDSCRFKGHTVRRGRLCEDHCQHAVLQRLVDDAAGRAAISAPMPTALIRLDSLRLGAIHQRKGESARTVIVTTWKMSGQRPGKRKALIADPKARYKAIPPKEKGPILSVKFSAARQNRPCAA